MAVLKRASVVEWLVVLGTGKSDSSETAGGSGFDSACKQLFAGSEPRNITNYHDAWTQQRWAELWSGLRNITSAAQPHQTEPTNTNLAIFGSREQPGCWQLLAPSLGYLVDNSESRTPSCRSGESGQFASKDKDERYNLRDTEDVDYNLHRKANPDLFNEFDPKEHPRDESGQFASKDKDKRYNLRDTEDVDDNLHRKANPDLFNEFDSKEHPRDESGQFVSKDQDKEVDLKELNKGRTGLMAHGDHSKDVENVKAYEEAKQRLADAASDVAKLRPRGVAGGFISDEKAGVTDGKK